MKVVCGLFFSGLALFLGGLFSDTAWMWQFGMVLVGFSALVCFIVV